MRPTRKTALMQTAFIWAERSTCTRLHVGCVLHRDGRILVQGYNGAPAGLEHCDHVCTCPDGYPYIDSENNWVHWYRSQGPQCPTVAPCLRSVHAEQNAISYAARWGVELAQASASVTHQPCLSCAQSLINAGIVSVTYVEPYRLQDGVNLLREAGIEVIEMVDWQS